jgi:hypothetical protein
VAWITDNQLKTTLAGVLQFNSAAELPGFWDAVVPVGNEAGYNWLRAALASRGYSPAQMDLWDARETWNRKAGLYETLSLANLDDDRALAALDRLAREMEQLATLTITTNGVPVDPVPAGSTGPNVGRGADVTTDDRFTLDTVL